MTPLATLVFHATEWLPYAIVVVSAVALFALWGYQRTRMPGLVKFLAFTMKILGVALLAACLLEPQWMRKKPKPGANFFAVVADNSQGMNIRDADNSESRAEQMRKLLLSQPADWRDALEDTFTVRRFYFGSRLHSAADFSGLRFTGRASSMMNSLESIGERYKGRPLAGVLLFSDGNATDRESVPGRIDELPPVFPVVIGKRAPAQDICLQSVRVVASSFEDAPVKIHCSVNVTGFADRRIEVRLVAPDGQTIDSKREEVETDHVGAMKFKFEIKPGTQGISFYKLIAGELLDSFEVKSGEVGEGVDISGEATLANNSRTFVVERRRDPFRVLYVAGRPNWEYKFLKRALDKDPQVNMTALIRIAKREPKFDFRGRSGESSNPLFRGFRGEEDDETGSYDKPILKRLNLQTETELKDGFPTKATDLYQYHAIILDDLEAAFFAVHQQELIRKFVSERGGGLMMLGGQDSFSQGKYQGTPVDEVLPVYLQRSNPVRPVERLRVGLTREGNLSNWVRLRESESKEQERLNDMPEFMVVNQVERLKPGASVLAAAKDSEGRNHPVLVSQRYGMGKSAALLIGDLWRWGMMGKGKRDDLPKAWRQMIRWLVTDVPARIEIVAQPATAGVGRDLQVRVKEPGFKPMEDAMVRLSVQRDGQGSQSVELSVEPSSEESGVFSAVYIPREEGGYRVNAEVFDADGKKVGDAEAGWASNPAADEFKKLEPNRVLLENIAERTGGRLLEADKLLDWARKLEDQPAPVMVAETDPLWHTMPVFLLALALLGGEWWLRRRNWAP